MTLEKTIVEELKKNIERDELIKYYVQQNKEHQRLIKIQDAELVTNEEIQEWKP